MKETLEKTEKHHHLNKQVKTKPENKKMWNH